MTTPAQFNDFAQECVRWAKEAKDASERDTLIRAARLWTQAALLLEPYISLASNPAALSKELRAKLD